MQQVRLHRQRGQANRERDSKQRWVQRGSSLPDHTTLVSLLPPELVTLVKAKGMSRRRTVYMAKIGEVFVDTMAGMYSAYASLTSHGLTYEFRRMATEVTLI